MVKALIPTAAAALALAAAAQEPPRSPASAPDFPTEVHPWLTRLGCNAAGCHGAATGQKGFRLSLFGTDPDADYAAITREYNSRRIDRGAPERSLLLRKALKEIPHGGGRALERGSEAHGILLEWAKAGFPRRTKEIDLSRVDAVAADGRVRVTAIYTDGSTRDVTASSTFASNDEGIVAVDAGGALTYRSAGGTAILVRHGGLVAVAPVHRAFGPSLHTAATDHYIDAAIGAQLDALGLRPSPRVGDPEYLRRVTLDLAGRLPTIEEIEAGRPDIDALLESAGFTRYWGWMLGRFLGARRPEFLQWIRERVEARSGWNEMARAMVTATGRDPAGGLILQALDAKVIGERMGERLLGTRWSCAACHDHPFERFGRDDYYGIAAFFARIRFTDGLSDSGEGEIRFPDTNLDVTPAFPGRKAPPEGVDRRAAFADWIVGPDLARAFVNRVWSELMGRGLVDPVDDFRSTNPPSNPALLEALSQQFIKGGWKLRKLLKDIVTSDAYARSVKTQSGIRADDRFHSRAFVRPLHPAVLADCAAQAAGTVRESALTDPKFQAPKGLAAALSAINGETPPPPSESVEELYLRTLSRKPTQEEAGFWRERLASAPKREILEDLWWALLNSKEFATNH